MFLYMLLKTFFANYFFYIVNRYMEINLLMSADETPNRSTELLNDCYKLSNSCFYAILKTQIGNDHLSLQILLDCCVIEFLNICQD